MLQVLAHKLIDDIIKSILAAGNVLQVEPALGGVAGDLSLCIGVERHMMTRLCLDVQILRCSVEVLRCRVFKGKESLEDLFILMSECAVEKSVFVACETGHRLAPKALLPACWVKDNLSLDFARSTW